MLHTTLERRIKAKAYTDRYAVDVARKFVNGETTIEELEKAHLAAYWADLAAHLAAYSAAERELKD